MSVIQAPGRSSDLARRTDLSNRRVLLLVRDPSSATRYEDLFQTFGGAVIPVFSAAALLEQLRLQRPDAIAYDLDLPDAGLHLIRRIRMRSRLEGGGTPALALTSALAPTLHTRAILAGFQAAVVAEPIDLMLAIVQVLGDRPEPN